MTKKFFWKNLWAFIWHTSFFVVGINLAYVPAPDTFGHTRTTNTPSHLELGSQVSSGVLSTEARDDSGIARAECFFFFPCFYKQNNFVDGPVVVVQHTDNELSS